MERKEQKRKGKTDLGECLAKQAFESQYAGKLQRGKKWPSKLGITERLIKRNPHAEAKTANRISALP